jgi:hypothetical protein
MLIIFLHLKNLVVGENMTMLKQNSNGLHTKQTKPIKEKEREREKSNIKYSEVSFLPSIFLMSLIFA